MHEKSYPAGQINQTCEPFLSDEFTQFIKAVGILRASACGRALGRLVRGLPGEGRKHSAALSPKRILQLIAKQIPVVQPPYESQQSQDH
jgi:hypothetical protein